MSIALIVTRGFGNGTLIGTIKDVVTRGYSIGSAIIPWPTDIDDATLRSVEDFKLFSRTEEITVVSQTEKITLRSV